MTVNISILWIIDIYILYMVERGIYLETLTRNSNNIVYAVSDIIRYFSILSDIIWYKLYLKISHLHSHLTLYKKYQIISNYIKLYQIISDYIKLYQIISCLHTNLSQIIIASWNIKLYQIISNYIKLYQTISKLYLIIYFCH